MSTVDKQEQMKGNNSLWLWYINICVNRSGCATGGGLSTPSKQSKKSFYRWNTFPLLKSATPGNGKWRTRWTCSTEVVTAWSQWTFPHSGLCSPPCLFIAFWFWGCKSALVCGHTDWVSWWSSCVSILHFSVLCLLLTFCFMLNVLEYVSREIAVAISASSPFLSRLWQTGTHRRPCCA